MKNIFILVIIIILTNSCACFKRTYNQRDDMKVKQGYWVSYWDEDEKQVCIKNYYKDGIETRLSKNYRQNGIMVSKFKYYGDRVRVKYYDNEGNLSQKGWAKIKYTAEEMRFYWEGKWKYYDASGKKIKESIYKEGAIVVEKVIN